MRVVNEQAEDGGLWFVPQTITEDILQNALRRLHEAVEGKSSEECARAALRASAQPTPPAEVTLPDGPLWDSVWRTVINHFNDGDHTVELVNDLFCHFHITRREASHG